MNSLLRCLKKDLLMELRDRTSLTVTITFAAITTLVIGLIIGQASIEIRMHAILIWIIIFFSAMNGLYHIFSREVEEGTALFLLKHHSAETIYLSKLIFNLLFFLAITTIICPLYLFFLQVLPERIILFLVIVYSGSLAIVSITTILAAMVSRAGGKGSLLTTIAFPLILPVLWTSIIMTENSFKNAAAIDYGNIIFLLAFSGVVICFSYLLFRFIWMEY